MTPKIVYSLILVAVFFLPVFYSLDIFVEAGKYRWSKVDSQNPIQYVSGNLSGKIKSKGKATLAAVAYDVHKESVAATADYPMKFYQTTVKKGLPVYTKEGKKMAQLVGYDLLQGSQMRNNYDIAGGFGFSLIAIWLALTVAVIIGCTGWTSCGK